MDDYHDRWIDCTDEGLAIRGYYFPWGTKRIAYDQVRSIHRFDMGALTGRGRIWGTGSLRHWANFDPQRPRKKVGFFLDLGGRVQPFVTPDDPDGFAAVLGRRTGLDGEGPSVSV